MSGEAHTIVKRRVIGSPTKKHLMLYLAYRGGDDDFTVWASKATMAAETELSKRTVQRTIQELEDEGLIKAIGKHQVKHGETIRYAVNLDAVQRLPFCNPRTTEEHKWNSDLENGCHGVTPSSQNGCHGVTPTGDTVSPNILRDKKEGSHEPSITEREADDQLPAVSSDTHPSTTTEPIAREVIEMPSQVRILSGVLPSDLAQALFAHRQAMPKSKRMSDGAAEMMVRKLAKFDPDIRAAMVENCIANGWQGLVDLKPHEIQALRVSADPASQPITYGAIEQERINRREEELNQRGAETLKRLRAKAQAEKSA